MSSVQPQMLVIAVLLAFFALAVIASQLLVRRANRLGAERLKAAHEAMQKQTATVVSTYQDVLAASQSSATPLSQLAVRLAEAHDVAGKEALQNGFYHLAIFHGQKAKEWRERGA